MNKRLSTNLGVILFFCTILLMTHQGFPQGTARELLNHLTGKWDMIGTVLGKPVQYTAEGSWILRDQWLCLHMIDTASPPEYEADLLIGIDTAMNEYVAHWLDSFGGGGARVAAFGPVSQHHIELIYPYAEGKFRNIFVSGPGYNEWDLVIESEDTSGRWSNFATFKLNRK